MIFVKNEKEREKKEKTPKPKYNMWQNTWFMIAFAWKVKEKKVIVFSFITACLAVTKNVINLYISPSILSVIERKGSVQELLLMITFFIGGLMLVVALSAYVTQCNFLTKIAVRLGIVNLVNRKTATTSYPNVEDKKFIKLRGKALEATNNNRVATEAIWTTLGALVENVAGFLIYVLLLTTVEPLLFVVILTTTVLNYFISNYFGTYGYKHKEEEAQHIQKMSYLIGVASDWSGAKDIRIFGLRFWLEELMEKATCAYMAFHEKAESVYIWSSIADLVLTFIRNGVAYIYLIQLVLTGELDVAQFLLLFSTVSGFASWVSGILGNLHTLYKQSLDIDVIRECLEYPEPFAFEEGIPLVAEEGKSYEIKLENISFRYPNTDKDTLTNINLVLHPKEKLAVVGLNGAGKTTLVKLMCGFLDPTKGRVLLNGVDIKTYNRRDYYKLFSAVFQEFSLLAGTIATNVAQTEENINIEKVKKCIEQADLREKIETMPKGYDTYLNREVYDEAVMLSGGETQRLMLARALYKDAPFVVLDEPTAALDPIAESQIYEKYNEMTKGKSSVYISHRLASTRFCDRIILIDGSNILEEGTHEELIQKGGKYAELFAVQSKYYEEGEESDGK